jgi:uncharacterized protein (DUF58 family)
MADWRELFDESFLKRLEQLHLLSRRWSGGKSPGQIRSRHLGDGLEFADHRHYAAGDDIRFVDWPYFARMERLLLRLFHQHSEAEVVVLLDVSASMAGGAGTDRFGWALQAAAALAYAAQAGSGRVTVAPFAEELLPPRRCGTDRAGLVGLLSWLAELSPGGATRLEHCCKALAAAGGRGRNVLLLSDLLGSQDRIEASLGHLLAAGCDIAVVHVQSPVGMEPPAGGEVVLRDSESGQRLAVSLGTEILEAYRERFEAFCGRCRRLCQARGVSYVPARTDRGVDELVLLILRRSGVLLGRG